MTQIIVKALEDTGQRGIINKGWGGLGNCKFFFFLFPYMFLLLLLPLVFVILISVYGIVYLFMESG